MTVDLLFRGAFLLHLLDAVAVPQQLEVLPRREEQDRDQEGAGANRAPHLLVPFAIDLPHDRVVANVLLDGVLEFRAHDATPISAARSLALRDRGLRAISASSGTTGRFVRIRRPKLSCCSARSVCFTIRSSREWNAITAIRPPPASRRATSPRNTSRPSSSRFTQMRTAWNVRVAGSIRMYPFRGTA